MPDPQRKPLTPLDIFLRNRDLAKDGKQICARCQSTMPLDRKPDGQPYKWCPACRQWARDRHEAQREARNARRRERRAALKAEQTQLAVEEWASANDLDPDEVERCPRCRAFKSAYDSHYHCAACRAYFRGYYHRNYSKKGTPDELA